MKKVKKAYDEILQVLNKYRDICVFNVAELESKAKLHLYGLELKEVYGLDVEPKDIRSFDWENFGDYRRIGLWGEKYRRTISWSVDGRQPEDEVLLQISFSTGAYIFGEDYPAEVFDSFWAELKTFKPDYTDDVNRGLYWKLSNAKEIFNSFNSIFRKYCEINRTDSKRRKMEKLKKELSELESLN